MKIAVAETNALAITPSTQFRKGQTGSGGAMTPGGAPSLPDSGGCNGATYFLMLATRMCYRCARCCKERVKRINGVGNTIDRRLGGGEVSLRHASIDGVDRQLFDGASN